MRLLHTHPEKISVGGAPAGASHAPAEIIFISAADTELAALSEARAHLGAHRKRLGVGQATKAVLQALHQTGRAEIGASLTDLIARLMPLGPYGAPKRGKETGRVIRSRVVNPKWIGGVKRHGDKGAFEMAERLHAAIDQGLWPHRSNSACALIERPRA